MSAAKSATVIGENVDNVGKRAGLRLEAAYPGRHKDKRIAADMRCSPSMARVLRAGRGWTVERLARCAERFGFLFIRDVFMPPLSPRQLDSWLAEIDRRVEALESGRRDSGDVGIVGEARSSGGSGNTGVPPPADLDRAQGPPPAPPAGPRLERAGAKTSG